VTTEVDHLVVAAATLEQGAAWCEAVLGATPAGGGQHVGMGTHNRLLALASPAFAKAYLEIIAIDPQAPPPARPRWFGLDDAQLQAALQAAPRLVHMVARTTQIEPSLAALAAQGVDAGRAATAERASPAGLLRWRIAGRSDGRLLFGGALPTLIEWGDMHPSDSLPPGAVRLMGLSLGGLPAPVAAALDLRGVEQRRQGPALSARLSTPRGECWLHSQA
jgi:hypothetical protein